MTQVEVAKVVAMLLASYPAHVGRMDPKLLQATARQYERMLLDLEAADVAQAIDELVATNVFFPTVAEIRGLIAKRRAGTGAGSGGLSSEEAWGLVLRAVSKFGMYRLPVFEDRLVARAVELMGWREICLSENQEATRAHFYRTYAAAAESSVWRENVGRLLESRGLALPAAHQGQAQIGDVIARMLPGDAEEVG